MGEENEQATLRRYAAERLAAAAAAWARYDAATAELARVLTPGDADPRRREVVGDAVADAVWEVDVAGGDASSDAAAAGLLARLGADPAACAARLRDERRAARRRGDAGLAARLRAARERAGLSQTALGRQAGLSNGQSQISAYERGRVRPRPAALAALAAALGVTVDWLEHGDAVGG